MHDGTSGLKTGRRLRTLGLGGAAAFAAIALSAAPAAQAAPAGETDPDRTEPRCVRDLNVERFSAADPVVDYRKSTTLSWRVRVPSGCTSLKLSIIGVGEIGRSGSRTVTPLANARYVLYAKWSTRPRVGVATEGVNVRLPNPITIDSNRLWSTFRQALGTDGTTIRVTPNVAFNVGGTQLRVAPGVKLLGSRSADDPGPRLYTTRPPRVLLTVGGDNVRISGMRIQGPDMGASDADGNCCSGIAIGSSVNVVVDNNEIFGWRNSGIEIRDPDNRLNAEGRPEVRIHDNFIHHNQHTGSKGYGVTVKDNAFAKIDRNVFDWNRHAIEGDGEAGTGYEAVDNLVLPNGGLHRWVGFWIHTHQFDMHGSDHCGVGSVFSDSLYNCGRAGYLMEIRFNSFLYTSDHAIKLRGTPVKHMNVISNVFKHRDIADAVTQTERGLYISDNKLGVDSLSGVLSCDVDGKGARDKFLATGQTWWYSSGGTRDWTFIKRDGTRPTTCPPRSRDPVRA